MSGHSSDFVQISRLLYTTFPDCAPFVFQAQAIVAKGDLLPDDMILEVRLPLCSHQLHIRLYTVCTRTNAIASLQLLEKRLQEGQAHGELGVLLDGFPRTRRQAQMLALIADTQLAVNLSLRPEVKGYFFLSIFTCCTNFINNVLAARRNASLIHACDADPDC